jgi:predicted dehydrogenase
MMKNNNISRRQFIKQTAGAVGLFAGWPLFVRSAAATNNAVNHIQIGCIGVGRMGLADLRDVLRFDSVRVTAVCDVDRQRVDYARRLVNEHYNAKGYSDFGCKAFHDFRDLIADPSIDAVQISTPDHWHAIGAGAAAKAGKDIFLQKPFTLTLQEGRILSDTVRRTGVIFQVGSQQRSDEKFRLACELVRNGRIGKLHTIKIGMGSDPATGVQPVMKVPDYLDYDMWLGPAPWAPYTENRVHPEQGYGRPGWLRIHDYCPGMITGWGSHHLDIAHWAMDTEYTGPLEITGHGQFPADGLWDVHTRYFIEYRYANGVKMIVSDHSRNAEGVRFEGTDGWVHVRRGAIWSSPASLITSSIGPNEIRLYHSNDHRKNFIDCIRTRRQTIVPAEIAHRSASACILGDIAMRVGTPLKWDPEIERFTNNAMADRMLRRSMRGPWHL